MIFLGRFIADTPKLDQIQHKVVVAGGGPYRSPFPIRSMGAAPLGCAAT
jgi:hypothetical protein